MPTLIVFNKATDEVLTANCGVRETTDPDSLGLPLLNNYGLSLDDYACRIIPGEYSYNEFMKFKSVSGGVIVVREETLAEAQKTVLTRVNLAYSQVCQGTDPVTGKDIYVDCTVNGTTYRMNAGRDAASTFDLGLDIAKKNNETTTFIVDFYNQVHTDVPLADALEVNLIQGLDARVHYQTKQGYKTAINSATTVEEVQAMGITFAVNVE